MKVLQVINSLHFGGAEKLLVDTVPEFKKSGIDVDVMVLYNEKTIFYKQLEDQNRIRVLAPQKLRSLYSFFHIFWIRKYVKQYDIIHVHLFPSLYWVALSTLFLKHKPILIVTEHNTQNRRRSSSILKYIDKFIYKKYNKIIAISEGVKNNLLAHLGKDYSAIQLINNGINTKFFKESIAYPKSTFDLPQSVKIVIQVASFTPQKDQSTLINAIKMLPEDVHLFLVGDGVTIDEKKKLASDLKIEHRVHFLGNRSDIPQLLKMANICVLSSHYEGFGLAIVEGMAAGLPCVGSDVDGLSQVIGDAGVLFEKGNHLQLQDKLLQLLSDKEYYQEVANRCHNRAEDYDISLMIKRYSDMYNTLIK